MKNGVLMISLFLCIAFCSEAHGVTGNSGSANNGFGYYITETAYSADGNTLQVKGFFVNSTCNVISGVKTLRLSINGRDGFVVAQAISNNRLYTLNLSPGGYKSWDFSILKPNKGKDLTRIDYNADCDLKIGETIPLPGGIKVYHNGKPIFYDVPPAIISGRILIPARMTFEKMGASVEWDDAGKTVRVKRGDKQVKIEIGKNQMTVNGVPTGLQVPAKVIDGRTMIPLRAVASALDCVVNWGDGDKMVVIVDAP